MSEDAEDKETIAYLRAVNEQWRLDFNLAEKHFIKYGRHLDGCYYADKSMDDGYPTDEHPCTCNLTRAFEVDIRNGM